MGTDVMSGGYGRMIWMDVGSDAIVAWVEFNGEPGAARAAAVALGDRYGDLPVDALDLEEEIARIKEDHYVGSAHGLDEPNWPSPPDYPND